MSVGKVAGGAERIPLHRRVIEFDAYDEGDCVSITGRLRDERPWASGTDKVEHVHDMELTLTIRKQDLTITAANATMARFPHAECPSITDAFGDLVGLSVSRGYTRAVQDRFGGARGCTHLEQLARTVGPVVIQAVTSARARDRDWRNLDVAPSARPALFARNTCHIWADGGVAEQKLEAGWRPGERAGYPAPPVEVFLRRERRSDA
ncbi:MAG TPA: DUF2889 domain-containing protein [Acidimicrobiales bacterium]|nr:DUF2889 domain-containing protein [Acidimicrobiales bacterium]